ncbi:hypothetical protein ACOCG7_01440 [Paraburkholderia sp. DD10]|jgi:hypothetical protein|uniref:hypothetical protein n=1 Tax=Paraburkholderia TaxID=1822464 RepID=UPI0009F2A8B8|nr:hypothetical protein [Paraburkholderia terricola]AXE95209.1 hypothetical protein CUJ90_23015 [Paraburkholderia terricola]ORC52273.1 hypothetical protein B2G74_06630 [Burkholderia sp. A27]
MEPAWQFQLRITVSPELADALRREPANPPHAALRGILRRHDATLKCQFDAFADYVSEAERLGTENFPLHQWTRATIENPEKKAKYLQSFTVYVNGEEVYDKEVADVIEAELLALTGEGAIRSVSRFDSNPANNPQPPQR